MGKVIYVMKIILFKDELEAKGFHLFEDGQYEKMVRFVLFTVHFYVHYWMECPISLKAPQNDLSMIKRLIH